MSIIIVDILFESELPGKSRREHLKTRWNDQSDVKIIIIVGLNVEKERED